jgi:hypothetical protein
VLTPFPLVPTTREGQEGKINLDFRILDEEFSNCNYNFYRVLGSPLPLALHCLYLDYSFSC